MNSSIEESEELERQAMTIYRQYGVFLPSQYKVFLKKLASFLDWHNLEGMMK